MEDHPEDVASNDANRSKFQLKSSLSPCFEDVLKSDTFIDKTSLIFEVVPNDVLLCTAPRRFGKTVNLTMIQSFLELEVDENGKEKTTILEEKDNYKLFNSTKLKLNVMKNKKFVETHFGQYPIIKVNFLRDCDITSRSEAVNAWRNAIHEAFKKHEYLYKSKDSLLSDREKNYYQKRFGDPCCKEITQEFDVVQGLALLAHLLNKFHKRQVFMLIDDYDSIILDALYHVKNANQQIELKELEGAAQFCIQVIGCILKTQAHILQGGFITGILNVGEITPSLSSVLGSVWRKEFGRINSCQDFYGFNEDEVCTLFDKWGVEEQLKIKAMAKYNGYGNTKKEPLYNPHSIVQFLTNLRQRENALQNYWQQSEYIQHLHEIFGMDDFRELLNNLLQDEVKFEEYIYIESPLELRDLKSLHNLLSRSNLAVEIGLVVKFLISLGYLTYSVDDKFLKIPNGELKDEFNKRLQNYFSTR